MGTSISHRSPKNLSWNTVAVAYKHAQIPVERIPSLIWRAAKGDSLVPDLLSGSAVFVCHQAVKDSPSASEALKRVSRQVKLDKDNSVVAQFARRAIPSAFAGPEPARQWRANLFAELTNYMASRDLSGFLGESYRNKTVNDLRQFKDALRSQIISEIKSLPGDPQTRSDWHSFVTRAIDRLTKSSL